MKRSSIYNYGSFGNRESRDRALALTRSTDVSNGLQFFPDALPAQQFALRTGGKISQQDNVLIDENSYQFLDDTE
jgi:hypothetical protein